MEWKRAIAKNWKTTFIGLITATSTYIVMFPDDFNIQVVKISQFIQVGGMASLGVFSNDFDKA